jgi:lipopolysaccharide/colanic/teichoic acid biosynthesis glycosyltransferase
MPHTKRFYSRQPSAVSRQPSVVNRQSTVPDGQLDIELKRDWTKRTFDLLLATGGILFLSPLLLFGTILAKLQSKGPTFYKATRVGRGGIFFEMYKFRTMVVNADSIGGSLTTYKDTRVTRIGRFLRWTKLDELPNLINVIKGEMSLIGPRPEAPVYVKYYTETQRQVLQVKPGMTGPSQLANRDEEEKLKGQQDAEHFYITELMPKKLDLDLHYIATQNIVSDIGWLLKTLWVLIGKK